MKKFEKELKKKGYSESTIAALIGNGYTKESQLSGISIPLLKEMEIFGMGLNQISPPQAQKLVLEFGSSVQESKTEPKTDSILNTFGQGLKDIANSIKGDEDPGQLKFQKLFERAVETKDKDYIKELKNRRRFKQEFWVAIKNGTISVSTTMDYLEYLEEGMPETPSFKDHLIKSLEQAFGLEKEALMNPLGAKMPSKYLPVYQSELEGIPNENLVVALYSRIKKPEMFDGLGNPFLLKGIQDSLKGNLEGTPWEEMKLLLDRERKGKYPSTPDYELWLPFFNQAPVPGAKNREQTIPTSREDGMSRQALKEMALSKALDWCYEKTQNDAFILLKSRLNALKNRNMMGLMSLEDLTIQENKIQNSFNYYVNELPDHLFN